MILFLSSCSQVRDANRELDMVRAEQDIKLEKLRHKLDSMLRDRIVLQTEIKVSSFLPFSFFLYSISIIYNYIKCFILIHLSLVHAKLQDELLLLDYTYFVLPTQKPCCFRTQVK